MHADALSKQELVWVLSFSKRKYHFKKITVTKTISRELCLKCLCVNWCCSKFKLKWCHLRGYLFGSFLNVGEKTTQREIKTDCSFNYVKWMGTQTMPIVVGNICFPSQKSEKLDRSNKKENTTGVSSAITWILLSADTGLYCTKFITKLSPRCFSSR